jgi:hypothetical protein
MIRPEIRRSSDRRKVDGRGRRRVIETVEHQEIDPSVAPVFRRRKGSSGRIRWSDGLVENSLEICSEQRPWHNAPPGGLAIRKVLKGPCEILTQLALLAPGACMKYGIWNREALVGLTVAEEVDLRTTDNDRRTSGGGCPPDMLKLVAAGVVLRGNQDQPRAARFGLLLPGRAAECVQNASDSDIGG